MPKAFSEHEREIVKTALLSVGANLIRKKGVRQVTVEDITRGADIAKGSFYAFYQSREAMFWEIIKLEEKQLVDRILTLAAEEIHIKTKLQKIFYDLFLHGDCIVFYLSRQNREYITRKLPPELIQEDMNSGREIIKSILSTAGLDESTESVEIVMAMIHSLQFIIASELLTTESARKKMLAILVEAFSDYLCKEDSGRGHEK